MLLELGFVLAVLMAGGVGRGRRRAKGIVIADSAGSGRGRGRGQIPASDKGKGKAVAVRPNEEELEPSFADGDVFVDEPDYGAPPPVGPGTDVLADMVMDTSVVESWWRSTDHKQSYLSLYSKQPVLGERVVNLDGIGNGFINMIFQRRHWRPILNLRGRVYFRLVQLFYANMFHQNTDTWVLQSRVLGVDVTFSAQSVATFLGLRRVPAPDLLNDKVTQTPAISLIYNTLCGHAVEVHGALQASLMTENYQVLHKVVCNTIFLTTHQSDVTVERARFLYALGTGSTVDLPSLIVKLVFQATTVTNVSIGLPFGLLISNFLLSKGVPIDIQSRAPQVNPSPLPPDPSARILGLLTEILDRLGWIEDVLVTRGGPLPPLPPRGGGSS
ncbi:hypothetical protein L1049_011227 [Liquidambar formosana]|uniref:Putative plant transposon protein domain-containing protein n=1 Tax=Liquidambar formosana TaxID=63359 RepID=A0AAP0X2K2_LIQFO